ncbi:MAG: hypothetical protein ACHQF2_00115 [Flavobacteriales bacterium]
MIIQAHAQKGMLQNVGFQAARLSHTTLFQRPDGILEAHCTDINYGINELVEIVYATGKISGNKRVPMLIISSAHSLVNSEAREYMASPESTKYSIAEAYVIKSTAQKILVNFYLRFNKPTVPTRFFSDITKAEKWLLSFTKK